MVRYYTLLIKTLERMVYIYANTLLMDKISDVDHEETNVDWM